MRWFEGFRRRFRGMLSASVDERRVPQTQRLSQEAIAEIESIIANVRQAYFPLVEDPSLDLRELDSAVRELEQWVHTHEGSVQTVMKERFAWLLNALSASIKMVEAYQKSGEAVSSDEREDLREIVRERFAAFMDTREQLLQDLGRLSRGQSR